ncbi:MAG: hypothetical protein HQ592_07035 [Planctomycetes bacterium]|nr:hypothetical protein [Planctomycetota bacterium]
MKYPGDEAIRKVARRRLADEDPTIALHAAILTCFAGDYYGYPLVKESVYSPDKKLRLKTVAVLGNRRFDKKRTEITSMLLERLKTESEPHIIVQIIQSLDRRPSREILTAYEPFLKHGNEYVALHAKVAYDAMKKRLRQR